jgi:hypothetical protein
MALNASGPISLAGSTAGQSIAVELGLGATSQISLNDAAVRTLAGVPSGAIVMPTNFYGKANEFAFTISSNTTNANLATLATTAGWNGTSKVIATVGSGIYVYSTSTGTPGLTVPNSFPNGVEIVNNGFILGMGGNSGGANRSNSVGLPGGNALNILRNVTITNNSYIAGGGGGGGSSYRDIDSDESSAGGGGGAGGGIGAAVSGGASASASTGGGPGSAGSNGNSGSSGQDRAGTGGGGGRILPGTGGSAVTVNSNAQVVVGLGGGAGGSGAAVRQGNNWGSSSMGGGGGGWGASGGLGGHRDAFSGTSGAGGSSNGAGGNSNATSTVAGGAGGKAVNLNGFSVTWVAEGNRYGAIS